MNNPYQTPQTTHEQAQFQHQEPAKPLTAKQILFTLKGRIPRRIYWLYTILNIIPVYAAIFFLMPEAFTSSEFNSIDTTGYEQYGQDTMVVEEMSPVSIGAVILLYIYMVWTGICISGKRWHDRDKSAWWILITFIPFIGGIWAFIENGCLRGTHGANRYGADPT